MFISKFIKFDETIFLFHLCNTSCIYILMIETRLHWAFRSCIARLSWSFDCFNSRAYVTLILVLGITLRFINVNIFIVLVVIIISFHSLLLLGWFLIRIIRHHHSLLQSSRIHQGYRHTVLLAQGWLQIPRPFLCFCRHFFILFQDFFLYLKFYKFLKGWYRRYNSLISH